MSTSWTLTAIKKAAHKVLVRKTATAEVVRTITLNVANRAPTHTSLKPPNSATLEAIFPVNTELVTPAELALPREYGKIRLYQLMHAEDPLDLNSYFTDSDGAKLTYDASSGN